MLDLNTLPILDTPVKVVPEIEGMPYPAYVGIGRRYEAGVKSLLDRAELNLELDSAVWGRTPENWVCDEKILKFRIIVGDDPGQFTNAKEEVAIASPCQSTTRLARATFATGLKLSERGRVTVLTAEELDRLDFGGELLVSTRNLSRVEEDPATRFKLDGEAIHSLTQRVLPEIAMYAITNWEDRTA